MIHHHRASGDPAAERARHRRHGHSGFMFCWNAVNYPLMLAGRETFPVTVGAIQFISYEQVLWGQMAAATIVATVPQLALSLMVQKYIVCGLTMGAVR